MAVHVFAAIDIGSFELELSVFEVLTKGEIRRLDRLRHVIALGSDTYENGVISYELLDEMCEVLNGFVSVIKGYQAEEVRVYATSAMREAKNRIIIEDQIKVRCGLEVQILSNSEQRFLCYKAIPVWEKQFYKIIEKESAIVDVGFGSMQISLYAKGALQCTQNIQIGALRMQSMLAGLQDSGKAAYQLAEELVDNEIDTFRNYYLKDKDVKHIIAIGDCMRIFAAKVMKLSRAESISAEDFIRVYNQVKGKNASDLALEYDIPTEFAFLVIPVAMIYYRIIRTTGAQVMWITGTSLSEGMVTEWAEKKKLIKLGHDFTQDILSEARHLSKRYLGNKPHISLLEEKSCAIFDAMKKYHGMGKRERLLLQLAAILHDCGKFISMTAPGDCSYDIITSSEILGISNLERDIVANVVRYNTVEFHHTDAPIGNLSVEAYRVIYKLTAILRIANALDRSHKQKFKNTQIQLRGGRLQIQVMTEEDITLEKGLFEVKARFFEEAFGILPEIKQKKV